MVAESVASAHRQATDDLSLDPWSGWPDRHSGGLLVLGAGRA